ncbi:hypothetical protein OJ920_10310, partial [Streptococcus anginosus]|nr:hypothetical protein [Streptococcus anginosus]
LRPSTSMLSRVGTRWGDRLVFLTPDCVYVRDACGSSCNFERQGFSGGWCRARQSLGLRTAISARVCARPRPG